MTTASNTHWCLFKKSYIVYNFHYTNHIRHRFDHLPHNPYWNPFKYHKFLYKKYLVKIRNYLKSSHMLHIHVLWRFLCDLAKGDGESFGASWGNFIDLPGEVSVWQQVWWDRSFHKFCRHTTLILCRNYVWIVRNLFWTLKSRCFPAANRAPLTFSRASFIDWLK